jgi:hypothetical protein
LGGKVLAQWDSDEKLARAAELYELLLTPKRVDMAVDLFGHGITLIQDVKDACERGELCGVRQYEPVEKRTRRGVWLAEGVNLGVRSGAAQELVLYDKNLEQFGREGKRGELVRAEGRFCGKFSEYALACLLKARAGGGEVQGWAERDGSHTVAAATWQEEALRLVLAIADFREPSRSSNRNLSRRARAAWWTEFLGAIKPHRAHGRGARTPSLDGFRRYLERCCLRPIRGLMRATGQSRDEVLSLLGLIGKDALNGERVSGRREVVEEYKRLVARKEAVA